MTKSQNTKNEQLTEQWQKGELPEGDYYLDIGSDTIIEYWVCNHWNWTEYDSRIKAVLCEVPTYDEYQALLSDQLAKNEGVEINDELEEENAQLKKLLKECAKIMREPAVYIGTLEEKERYINNLHKKQQLLHEIDEVLK